jgi:hypothetical protein
MDEEALEKEAVFRNNSNIPTTSNSKSKTLDPKSNKVIQTNPDDPARFN